MRNLRLVIAYDGSPYRGWQHQPGLPTVERHLADVLSPITQTRVTLTVAGRTDAGVHARGQVANFQTESAIDTGRLRRAANSRLEPGVMVRRIDDVASTFNARFDALGKHYRYTLWADAEKPPFDLARYVYHWHRPFDLPAVARAARQLVGRHDFKSFETTGSQPRRSTVCHIMRLDVRRQGPTVTIDVEGDRFLYRMVRNLVGTLLDVGRGHWPAEHMAEILAARDRAAAGPTAPPNGLCLMQVLYDEHAAQPSSRRPAPDADAPAEPSAEGPVQ